MERKTLNVSIIFKAFTQGFKTIIKNGDKINKLDPDKDSGNNVSETIMRVYDFKNKNFSKEYLEKISNEMIKNPQEYSGRLFARIFKGLVDIIKKGNDEITTHQWIVGFKNAVNWGYSTFEISKEGTILTLIREISEELEKRHNEIINYQKLIEILKKQNEESYTKLTKDSGATAFYLWLSSVIEEMGKSI